MRIGSSNDDKMTCTMIGAWLAELFLHERSEQLMTTAVDELKGSKPRSGVIAKSIAGAIFEFQRE